MRLSAAAASVSMFYVGNLCDQYLMIVQQLTARYLFFSLCCFGFVMLAGLAIQTSPGIYEHQVRRIRLFLFDAGSDCRAGVEDAVLGERRADATCYERFD